MNILVSMLGLDFPSFTLHFVITLLVHKIEVFYFFYGFPHKNV